mgnify:CR=1 FL=1
MEHLKIEPEVLKKRFTMRIEDYNYTCFDILEDHLDISIFIDYLNSMEVFKLKNIWNHIILRWIQMDQKLKDKLNYKRSKYSKEKYRHIHTTILSDEFNGLLSNFITNDIMKGLFVINCIENYII